MWFFNVLISLLCIILVTACTNSRYSTKEKDYLGKSKTLPRVRVPSGMSLVQKPYYSIPSTSASLTINRDSPSQKPPSLLKNKKEINYDA